MRGLAADEQGRTVILGLDAAETKRCSCLGPQISAEQDFRSSESSTLRGASRSGAQHPGKSIHRTGPQ